jgi:hypothetical protein
MPDLAAVIPENVPPELVVDFDYYPRQWLQRLAWSSEHDGNG